MIGNLMSIKDIHKSFEEHWTDAAEDRDDIQYKKGKNFKALLMDGKDLLTAWHNKLSDEGYRVLAIEEAFSFTLPGIPIPVIGGIDLIEEDDAGTIIVTDFKTSGKAYSIGEVDGNQQLTTYQMAIKSNGIKSRNSCKTPLSSGKLTLLPICPNRSGLMHRREPSGRAPSLYLPVSNPPASGE